MERLADLVAGQGAFDISFVFNRHVLGDEFCKQQLGLTDADLEDWNLDIVLSYGRKESE